MKNVFRFLGVIALVAAIGFSMIACGDSGGGGDWKGTWKNKVDPDDVLTIASDFSWTRTKGTNTSGTLSESQSDVYLIRTISGLGTAIIINDPEHQFSGQYKKGELVWNITSNTVDSGVFVK